MRALLGILSGLFLMLALGDFAFAAVFSGWEGSRGASPLLSAALVLYFLCFFVSAVLHSRSLLPAGIIACVLFPFAAFGVFRVRGVSIGDQLIWLIPMALVALVWFIYYRRQRTLPNDRNA